MPQSLTSICTSGSSRAAIDCSDDTPDVTRTTALLRRPYGFALDGSCAAAYACDMLCRFQCVTASVLTPAAPCSARACFESGNQESRKLRSHSLLMTESLGAESFPGDRGTLSLQHAAPVFHDSALNDSANPGPSRIRKPRTRSLPDFLISILFWLRRRRAVSAAIRCSRLASSALLKAISFNIQHSAFNIQHFPTSSAPLTNTVSRNRLKGLGTAFSADGATGILTAESVSIDARGNQTVYRTVIDRGNKTVYRLTYAPGSSVAALSTTVDGLLVSSRSASGLVTTYAYDALGRMTASQDARGGVRSRGYDGLGRVAWESDPATNGTWYAYDALGRRTAVTNALGDVTWTEYDLEGRAVKTYGATYPVEYDYDAVGRMTAMRTFRDEQGAGDETRWLYDAPTGLLTNKVYADGKGTSYTYTPDGQLASRTWARGVTTTYAYTNGSSLAAINYSDDTPDVAFTYDRLGRMTSAIVAGVSTNTYAYDALDLVLETQNGVEITRVTDALGRDEGFNLGPDYAVEYGYDAYGRFHSVSSSVQSVSSVATYSYLEDTDLISGMTASSGFLWTRAYESARSLITSVENSFGETVISRYDYENNELGQRTHIERSGPAFGDLPVRDAYDYNPRSEVTSARRIPVGSQTELRGFSYDYTYDPIGNRITSTEYDHEGNALESEYTANALNQYGQRTVPGYAGVRGEADTNATVTVNADPAWRYGEYFYGGDAADNSADAVMKELEITATYSNLFTSVTGRVFVAETPETFQYDYDGNLTQDGRFDYDWDAENRLIGVTTRDDLPTGVPRVKVEYAYDHQGRMVWKQVSTNAVVLSTRTLLWDGFNIVRATISNQQSSITNSYVWGLDLSGTLQGAGGVGGLLAEVQDGVPYIAAFDANGNVTEYLSADGVIAAHYEYSPFGEIVVQSGDLADAFTHRFSTKPWCAVTGLSEYEYRKYSPGMGRWLSRDPIGERAGVNVLHFVFNAPCQYVDVLGWGSWLVKEVEIDLTRDDISFEASVGTSEEGFEVQYTPDKGECDNTCEKIVLVQAISSVGLGGWDPEIDGTAAEKERNQRTPGGTLHPEMNPKGESDYSYIDSPNHGFVSKYKLTAAAECHNTNGTMRLLSTYYFEFSHTERKIIKRDATKKSHYRDAAKDWNKSGGSRVDIPAVPSPSK